jgi:putative chitinase
VITLQQFQQMIPTNREAVEWHSIAMDMFPKYNINTTNRIAGFMAQCAHESGDFRVLEENLNYSAEALTRVFGRYFGPPPKRNAADYARNPQKIANYVYMDEFRSPSGRLGNVRPGDGWKFRGGGIKQLTGRNNFARFGASIGMTADQAADYVRTKKGAFESACWFWQTNNLERFADRDDIDGMSRAVNGGDNGLVDRRNRYNRAKTVIGRVSATPAPVNPQVTDAVTLPQREASQPIPPHTTLRRGSSGELVRQVQRALKLGSDGVYGVITEQAVRSWQRINRFTVNGVLNAEQINRILGRT